jgi:hypothetical protein
MHSRPQLGTDLTGQLRSTVSSRSYPTVCKAARYIFQQNSNCHRKSCPMCPAPDRLTKNWCIAYNFIITTGLSASSPSDYAVTRLDLLRRCLKALVSSETVITFNRHFFLILYIFHTINVYMWVYFQIILLVQNVREVTTDVSVITFGCIQGVHFTQILYTAKKSRSYLCKNADSVLSKVRTGLSVYS